MDHIWFLCLLPTCEPCWKCGQVFVDMLFVPMTTEPEAVDLLLEVDQLDQLEQYVDDKNYGRTCLYLVSCCTYLPEPDDMQVW